MSERVAGLEVAVLSDVVAGLLCGRHLRLLGARVRRVTSGGDPCKSWGLHAPGALYQLLTSGMEETGEGARSVLNFADVVVADAGRLLPNELPAAREPRLLLIVDQEKLDDGAAIGSETAAQAVLGLTDYVGDPSTRPLRTCADIASVSAAVAGSIAVLAWLLTPARDGWSVVTVSPLRALSCLKTVIWAARTGPDEWSGSHVVARDRLSDSGYRVSDGWVSMDFGPAARRSWEEMCRELGLEDLIVEAGDRWWETVGWGDDVDRARPRYEGALAGRSREEAAAVIRRNGGSSVPFLSPREVLGHPQARALGLELGRLPWRVLRGPVSAGLVAPTEHDVAAAQLPLKGIRVLDFGVGGVAPFAGTLLAQLGAEVVRVEPPADFIHAVRPYLDGWSTTFLCLNAGKVSVRLDLKSEDGAATARDLAARADVLLENFRPGVLSRLGFGYEAVARENRDVVYCSASGFGSAGPLSTLLCTDPHIQAFAGWAVSNGGTSGVPRRTRYYALLDLVTALIIVEAVLGALVRRHHVGEGSHVEVSMLEAVVHAHLSRWVGVEHGETWTGERLFAPDGIYATSDGWLALSVPDDESWDRLLDRLGRPALLERAEWRTNGERLRHEEELNTALDQLLSRRAGAGWLSALADTGIPAARLGHDDDVVLRRDLWRLDLLREMKTASSGRTLRVGGPPWAFEPPARHLAGPVFREVQEREVTLLPRSRGRLR
jgi:CoA:oxalate CoA-transferase